MSLVHKVFIEVPLFQETYSAQIPDLAPVTLILTSILISGFLQIYLFIEN